MSNRANFVSAHGKLDVQGLARAGESVVGIVPLADFKRAEDQLATGEGTLAFTVTGVMDARGRPVLRVKLEGQITLNCQRCLLPYPYELDSETEILLAATEAELSNWDEEDGETVLASAPMDLHDLLEDELLLALPFAPRHPEGVCAPVGRSRGGAKDANQAFAALASIKSKARDQDH
jgi:uncharacterized protein